MTNPQKSYLPSISDILSSPTIRGLAHHLRPAAIYATAMSVLNDVATEVKNAADERRMPDIAELAEKIVARLRLVEETPAKPSINATGVLFHQEFGGPPMANLAIEQMTKTLREGACEIEDPLSSPAVPATLEDVEAVTTTPLSKSPLKVLLTELTGAADAMVFNSRLGALTTLFSGLGQPDEVRQNLILSVSDVYERPDGSRLTDVIDPRTISMSTVGTINQTTLDDYEHVMQFEEQGILYCTDATNDCFHPCKQVPDLGKIAELSGKYNAPFIFDTEWGTFHETAVFGLTGIPVIKNLIRQGCSLVIFSTDGLNGGPRLTVLAGEKTLLHKIRKSRLGTTCTPTDYDLAALETTLAIFMTRDRADMEIPVWELISTNPENLKLRSQRMAAQLASIPEVAECSERPGAALLTPFRQTYQLPSWQVVLTLRSKTAQEISHQLRYSKPGVAIQTVPEKPHQVILDLRTVFARQDVTLIETVQKILSAGKNY